MKHPQSQTLLGGSDPSPVQVVNPGGIAPFLLIGDHAGNRIPASLGSLGVGPGELTRHIGWDIGIAGLGAALAEALDATFLHQAYSRLVIDCNRDPAARDAMPAVADGTVVPANRDLTPEARAARVAAIHTPYQTAIAEALAARDAAGDDPILVSLHSFTPSMGGYDRPWQVGVLHSDGDTRFSHAMLAQFATLEDCCVGDNEPYAMDGIDYTVPRHAFAARRRYVEIEVRQDLLATPDGEREWARTLATLLPRAAATTPSQR